MTTGIYKLSFPNTNKVYIGQSGNCELRFMQHCRKLKQNAAAKKLQDGYKVYGEPCLHIIHECKVSELDNLEIFYIKEFDSLNDGFNSTTGGDATPILRGADNPNSKYTLEDYWNVLYFLGIPGYSWKQIALETNVSESVISHISAGESHQWLADKYPEEYEALEKIRNSDIGRMSAYMQGIHYPKIISPDGEEFEVQHCTNFAKEHGLSQPKLSEVLNGKRDQYKGWKLADTVLREYPEVISPSGDIYSIPYKGAAKFAREHNLTHTHLHRLLTGKANSHKGWKLNKVE